MADILADQVETLGEPYSRHLSGKTRELRFYLERSAVRISYWLAPGRRVVLLTVLGRPDRSNEHKSTGLSLHSGCVRWGAGCMRQPSRCTSVNGYDVEGRDM
jgi:hypothetical protein